MSDEHDDALEAGWDSALRLAFRCDADPAPPELVRSERYALAELLATGGMGEVWRAEDCELGRPVAVKRLKAEWMHEPLAVRRFLREARLTARLQHPGVAAIHDVGLDAEGRPFLAMRLVLGETLEARLAARPLGSRSRLELLDDFEAVLETVAHAHAMGIIHRDVKPANIMVGAFGEVVVMDWGFAKELSDGPEAEVQSESSATDLSIPGSVMGTPKSIAPEQARGEQDEVGPPADVFALGSLLLKILTDIDPWPGRSARDLLAAARAGQRQDCDQALQAQGIGPELAGLVRSALELDPKARPPHAGALLDFWRAFRRAEAERAAELQRAADEARGRAALSRRNRKLSIALCAVLGLSVLGAGFAAMARAAESAEREGLVRGRLELVRKDRSEGSLDAAAAALQALIGIEVEPELRAAVQAEQSAITAARAERELLKAVHRARGAGGQEDPEAFLLEALGLAAIDDWERGRIALSEGAAAELALGMDAAADAVARRGEGERAAAWRRAAMELDLHALRRRAREAVLAADRSLLDAALAEAVLPSEETSIVLAQAAQNLGDEVLALRLLREAARQRPDGFWLHFELARQLRERRAESEEAERHAAMARALRPEALPAVREQAVLMMQRGRREEALESLERAFRAHPDDPELRGLLAGLYAELGRDAEAERLRGPRGPGRPGQRGPEGEGPLGPRGRAFDADRYGELLARDLADDAERLELAVMHRLVGELPKAEALLQTLRNQRLPPELAHAVLELEARLSADQGQRKDVLARLARTPLRAPPLQRLRERLMEIERASELLAQTSVVYSLRDHQDVDALFSAAIQDGRTETLLDLWTLFREEARAQAICRRYARDVALAALSIAAPSAFGPPRSASQRSPEVAADMALDAARLALRPGERPRGAQEALRLWSLDPRLRPLRDAQQRESLPAAIDRSAWEDLFQPAPR